MINVKEYLVCIKLLWTRNKELKLQCRLLEHQSRMIDTYKKYKGFQFENHETADCFNRLQKRLEDMEKEIRIYGNSREGSGC